MRTFPLASYSVLDALRVGGLSQSHLAQRVGQSGPERVVLKQLLPSFADSEPVIARWLQKAEQNSTVSHPGCVRVLDWGRCGGAVYVAVENVEGVSLKDILRFLRRANERLPLHVAVYIARSALDALAYGHDLTSQLAHLDVSPYSLIVKPDGALALTEFGMWAALEPAEIARLRFDRGRVNYVSPEQAKSQLGDARSDIFSLGVLLHEMLVGELPFVGSTQLMIAMAIAENKRKPLREVASGLSDGLSEVVEHLLAHKPEERFQNARAALNALTAVGPVDPSAVQVLAQIAAQAAEAEKASAQAPAGSPSFGAPFAQSAPAWAPAAPLPRSRDQPRTEQLNLMAMRSAPALAAPPPEASPPAMAPSAHGRSPSPVPPPLLAGAPPPFIEAPPLHLEGLRSSPVPPPMLAMGAPPAPISHLAAAPLLMPPLAPIAFPSAPPLAMPPPSLSEPMPGPASAPALSRPAPAATPASIPFAAAAQASPVSAPPSRAPLPMTPPAEPFAMPRTEEGRWRDPSQTLFQMKSFAKGETERRATKTPLWLAVLLATIFGFAVVAGGYLIFRLMG